MPVPEHIHPAVWRASQLARGAARTLPTGHAALSAELPDGGWPLGSLIEVLTPHPGSGEIRLLRPALAQLETRRPIALVQPPHPPHIASWMSWKLDPRQLLWVAPEKPADALWATEQILKNGSCGAVLCWLPQVRPESLRRLHLAAQAGDLFFVALRPAGAARSATPAGLRLALEPAPGGVWAHLLKRRGPPCENPVYVALEPGAAVSPPTRHAPLDRRLPALSAAGRAAPALAA
ncbi:translesion DNA synthesis-associated protein ImuA [Achromobacter sp. Marseille-Q4962]|uniref:translesion DNA synthesis-associated protein ImuA n=2 Tax=unclassified Achromobacter TaxID=2626865 RepID=UPI002074A78A|nr:translesion DNA synthesis-associated protein ImuA [Achromobacter sp. Marseille-Q4962]